MKDLKTLQAEAIDEGKLSIQVKARSTGGPVKGASVEISYTGNPNDIVEEITTDESGNTDTVELDAPPLEYSMEPSEMQP